jgi:hypothetical protein
VRAASTTQRKCPARLKAQKDVGSLVITETDMKLARYRQIDKGMDLRDQPQLALKKKKKT